MSPATAEAPATTLTRPLLADGMLGTGRAAQVKDLAQVTAAQSGHQIVQSSIGQRSALRPILEEAGVAAVIAFVVVLGLSLLPDLFRRQRADRPQEPATTSAAAASTAEPVASPAPQPVDPSAPTLVSASGHPRLATATKPMVLARASTLFDRTPSTSPAAS